MIPIITTAKISKYNQSNPPNWKNSSVMGANNGNPPVEPEEIMTNLMAERKKLIMGHYGDPNQDKKKLDESLLPNHYAISLSGEQTMYPKLQIKL